MPASPPHRSSSPLHCGPLAALLLLSASACVLLPGEGGCSSRGGQGSGCARVEGRVLDAAGDPLSGAVVTLRPPEGNASYDFPVSTTGGSGRFSLRINRKLPGQTDTVTMWLRAALPLRPAIPSDSVQVHLHIAPVGEEPETVHQDLVITDP
jgi:hypothetical protein